MLKIFDNDFNSFFIKLYQLWLIRFYFGELAIVFHSIKAVVF